MSCAARNRRLQDITWVYLGTTWASGATGQVKLNNPFPEKYIRDGGCSVVLNIWGIHVIALYSSYSKMIQHTHKLTSQVHGSSVPPRSIEHGVYGGLIMISGNILLST